MNSITNELVNDKLAQTTTSAEVEAEGCGDTARGQPVVYHGPSEYAPLLRANHTPGMNIMAQTEGMSGEAGPTPMEHNLAQSKSRNTRGNFAQVEQSSRTHTCETAMWRNKNTFDDYTTIQAGSDKYTDVNFPTNDALYWRDAGEAGRDMAQLEDSITWQRISDPDQDFPATSFFGPNGISSVSP